MWAFYSLLFSPEWCVGREKKWNKGKLTEFFLMNKNVYTDAKGLFSEFETFIGDK